MRVQVLFSLRSHLCISTIIDYSSMSTFTACAWSPQRMRGVVTQCFDSAVGLPAAVCRAAKAPHVTNKCCSAVGAARPWGSAPAATRSCVTAVAAAAAAPSRHQLDDAQVVNEQTALDAAEVAAIPESVSDAAQGPPVWCSFLQQLWHRGYFKDGAEGKTMSAAIANRRDIKKALQQFGRSRPDIVLQLPHKLLQDLAGLQYPDRIERKAQTGLQRLKKDTAAQPAAASAAGGRVSTQDVLRVLWVVADIMAEGAEGGTSTAAGSSVADVLDSCATALLDLEQQQPDAALMAAAEAAASTPTAASYQQHQAVRQEAVTAARERRVHGSDQVPSSSSSSKNRALRTAGGEGSSSSRLSSSNSTDKRGERTTRFPTSDDPAVQHKMRLLRSAPYTELRSGDWFCGQCFTHNYAFKQQCFRCDMPSNSLGASKVSVNDVRQLQQIGLGTAVAYEQRPAAAAFALQVAQCVTTDTSLPAAAKAAGLTRFHPVQLPVEHSEQQQQEYRQGSSSASTTTSNSRASGFAGGSSSNSNSSSSRGRGSVGAFQGRSWGSNRSSFDLKESGSRGEKPRGRDRQRAGDIAQEREQPAAAAAAAAAAGDSDDEGDTPSNRSSAMQPATRTIKPAHASDMTAASGSSSSSSSGGTRATPARLVDTVRDAFAGLQVELRSSGIGPSQPRPSGQQQQQQGEPGMPQAAAGGRVRRVTRRRVEEEAAADGPELHQAAAEDGAASSSSSSSSSRSSNRRPKEQAAYDRAARGFDGAGDDDDDLSGWSEEYGELAGVSTNSSSSRHRGLAGRGAAGRGRQPSGPDRFGGWDGRGRGGAQGNSRADVTDDRDSGRGSSGGQRGSGRRRRTRGEGGSKPSWVSIFE